MSKLLLEMIDAVAYEKGMPKVRVQDAMEQAIAALARREAKAPEGLFQAEIAPDGDVHAWRVWEHVDTVENPERERPSDDQHAAGSQSQETMPTPSWNRQGLQVVKQVLSQRLREGLRQSVAEDWQERVGEVVMGQVKRVDPKRIIVDLGEPAEGTIGGRDLIPNERFRVGDRIRALVLSVDADNKGSTIVLSRSHEDFVRALVTREVPEVGLGQIVIHSVARDPGQRAKVAVSAAKGLRNSATGTCVGMRGVRAQAVSNEINGERLDFIEWSDRPAEYILSALAPAEVKTMVLDETARTAQIGVKAENLGRAIGVGGQNIRLATKLTHWKLEIMSSEDLAQKRADEDTATVKRLAEGLNLDEDFALVLVENGFYDLTDLAWCSPGDLLVIDGLDEDMVTELQERAKEALIDAELAQTEAMVAEGPKCLADLPGISGADVKALEDQGITTLEALADCAVMDVIWNEDRDEELGQWIMAAREATGALAA